MLNKVLTINIAAFNAERYLNRCLDSMIKCKSIDSLEIQVIDDGSTDNTKNIAEKYQREFPNSIKVISKANGGHGSTINTGIINATGKYFKIVDADDWVDSENLDVLVSILQKTAVDLIINPYYKVRESDHSTKELVTIHNKDVSFSADQIDINQIANHLRLLMHGMTFHTSVLKKMGPNISENCFYVDTEYTILPLIYVHSVMVRTEPIYNYLIGSSGQSMADENMIKRRAQHLHVVQRTLNYYEVNKTNLSKEVSKLIRRRIYDLVMMQYRIYIRCHHGEEKHELNEYEKWLKSKDLKMYEEAALRKKSEVSGTKMLIGLYRKFGYTVYSLIKRVTYGRIKKKSLASW